MANLAKILVDLQNTTKSNSTVQTSVLRLYISRIFSEFIRSENISVNFLITKLKHITKVVASKLSI